MTKMDLVEMIAKKADMSKKGAGDALEAVLDSIASCMVKGDKCTITGFGTSLVSSF